MKANNSDMPSSSYYVAEGTFGCIAFNVANPTSSLSVADSPGEVFRIAADGTIDGDVDKAIAVLERQQDCSVLMSALRAIKRLQEEIAKWRNLTQAFADRR